MIHCVSDVLYVFLLRGGDRSSWPLQLAKETEIDARGVVLTHLEQNKAKLASCKMALQERYI